MHSFVWLWRIVVWWGRSPASSCMQHLHGSQWLPAADVACMTGMLGLTSVLHIRGRSEKPCVDSMCSDPESLYGMTPRSSVALRWGRQDHHRNFVPPTDPAVSARSGRTDPTLRPGKGETRPEQPARLGYCQSDGGVRTHARSTRWIATDASIMAQSHAVSWDITLKSDEPRHSDELEVMRPALIARGLRQEAGRQPDKGAAIV